MFSRAAADFPRSDYRPSWLYWAGRAQDAMGDRLQAQARFTLAATDYLNSYYGRLALARLDGRAPERRLVVAGRLGGPAGTDAAACVDAAAQRRRAFAISLLAQIYDQAADELRYAQNMWGDSSAISATLAWTYREQGKVETGSVQFSLYRGAINLMKRAYPQYLAAGGEQLPRDILRVIYPIAYWESIQSTPPKLASIRARRRGARRPGVDVRGQHPIAGQGGRAAAARTADRPADRAAAQYRSSRPRRSRIRTRTSGSGPRIWRRR